MFSRMSSDNEVFQADEFGVLPPASTMSHRLELVSSYGLVTGEPRYTNYTGDFIGCLDYILYRKSQLSVVGVLQVDDEAQLREYTALPSPKYPSDHIFLVSEFQWI